MMRLRPLTHPQPTPEVSPLPLQQKKPRGGLRSEYQRQRIIESNRTRVISEETRRKQRESHKGQIGILTPECLAMQGNEENRKKATEANRKQNRQLTFRQKKFIAEYLSDPTRNALASAGRAGYTNRYSAYELFNHPQIKTIIDQETKNFFQKYEITSDRILQEMANIAFSDLSDFLEKDPNSNFYYVDLDKVPKQKLAALKEYSVDITGPNKRVRIQLYDKVQALLTLGKYCKTFEEEQSSPQLTINFFDSLLAAKKKQQVIEGRAEAC